MSNSIDKLKNKISGKDASDVEYLVDMARELHCVPELIGREYEVYDKDGGLVFRVKQKPMKLVQLNVLLKALHGLRKREEKAMKKGKK